MRALLGGSSATSETGINEKFRRAVTDGITGSNDKPVELKPANESKGRSHFRLIALLGGVIAIGYWLRSSQKPTETLQSGASEPAKPPRK